MSNYEVLSRKNKIKRTTFKEIKQEKKKKQFRNLVRVLDSVSAKLHYRMNTMPMRIYLFKKKFALLDRISQVQYARRKIATGVPRMCFCRCISYKWDFVF